MKNLKLKKSTKTQSKKKVTLTNIQVATDVTEYTIKKERDVKQTIMNYLFPKKEQEEIIINMELNNGYHVRFIVDGNKEYFLYKNGLYHLDSNLKYWCSTTKKFELDYHQNFSSPLKREWDIDDIINSMKEISEQTGDDFTISATNPRNLKNFIDSKVIEGILRGQQIQEFIKKWNVAFMIIILVVVIHFVLFLSETGMLNGLKFW